MLRRLPYAAVLLTVTLTCPAQKPVRRNAVLAQLGGAGFFASLHYERQLLQGLPLRASAGAGIYGLRQTVPTVPLGLRWAIPLCGSDSFIDVGAAATWTAADPLLYMVVKFPEGYVRRGGWSLVPSVTYRHEGQRDFLFRAGLSPVINRHGLLPLLEFSFGKSF